LLHLSFMILTCLSSKLGMREAISNLQWFMEDFWFRWVLSSPLPIYGAPITNGSLIKILHHKWKPGKQHTIEWNAHV
jgi:hypothetical protein